MKNIALIVLMSMTGMSVTAQKTNATFENMVVLKYHLYTDGGISLSQLYPGLSVTYNYRFFRWAAIGAGIQGYAWFPTLTNNQTFMPGVFGDLRFVIRPRKRSQFFTFLDIGVDFYRHSNNAIIDGNYIYTVPDNNGKYTGLGIGFFRRINERNRGWYVSVKLVDNGYKTHGYNVITNEHTVVSSGRGTMAVSGGFKF